MTFLDTGAAAMTRLLLAALLTALTGGAAAQTITVAQQSGETETVQTAEAEAPAREPVRTCMRSTGSRVVAAQNLRAEKEGKPQRCANSSGRVYTKEDIDRTGHVNIADALRTLDTSLR